MLILRACEPFGGRLGPASARPSRQPLRGFLRMRFFLIPSRRYLILRRRTAPSRRTQDVRAAHHLPIHSQALRMTDPERNVVVASPREPFATKGGNDFIEAQLIAENDISAVPFVSG